MYFVLVRQKKFFIHLFETCVNFDNYGNGNKNTFLVSLKKENGRTSIHVVVSLIFDTELQINNIFTLI